jgi:hypothetical protein
MYIKQMQVLVGILIGIFLNLVNLQKYKLNQFYDWHCDSWDQPYNNLDNKDTHGKIRKLSVTCSFIRSKRL